MIQLPDTNKLDLVVDWCEYYSITKGGLSKGKLSTILQRENQSIDLADDVFLQLEDRLNLFGAKYPFKLSHTRIETKSNLSDIYKFMLELSLGIKTSNSDRKKFELIVGSTLGGTGFISPYNIGFPRQGNIPKNLGEAIREFGKQIHHDSFLVLDFHPEDKDYHMDILCSLKLGDHRGGICSFIGQCATGENWTQKTTEINLNAISRHLYFLIPPIRFMAIPFLIQDKEKFLRASAESGLILDRARIIANFFNLTAGDKRKVNKLLAAQITET
jgi:hypothetical protein